MVDNSWIRPGAEVVVLLDSTAESIAHLMKVKTVSGRSFAVEGFRGRFPLKTLDCVRDGNRWVVLPPDSDDVRALSGLHWVNGVRREARKAVDEWRVGDGSDEAARLAAAIDALTLCLRAYERTEQ